MPMSDQFYRQRAAKRARALWVILGVLLSFGCIYLVVVGLFRDDCTNSFDRSLREVIGSYLEAVSRGEVMDAQACWQHEAFFDLGAGCSEVCLVQVYGNQFDLVDVHLTEETTTSRGRANIQSEISIVCTFTGETHKGEITLESVARNLPWRHWEIVRSGVGGTVAEPWCGTE